MVYIILGVSGSGKTTIGQLLAQKLGLPFYDGDDFHFPANIDKMKKGIPLTDEDREGWLKTLDNHLVQWQAQGGAVLACSCLKEKYRTSFSSLPRNAIEWIFLEGSEALIRKRLNHRKNHFMGASLLRSQFEILEEPPYGIKVQVNSSPEMVVEIILNRIG